MKMEIIIHKYQIYLITIILGTLYNSGFIYL